MSDPACSPVWKLAFSRPVVLRALAYSLVVGLVLAAINHGGCVLAGCFNRVCAVQCLLTACVPYVVSTLSSVQAIRQSRQLCQTPPMSGAR